MAVANVNSKVVAMDCEFVGVGRLFRETGNGLARCCLIDYNGEVLLDSYCKPDQEIVTYRTAISGITPKDLLHAPPFSEVRERVVRILNGKILVGHSVDHDLEALRISHPAHMTRDTYDCPLLPIFTCKGRGRSLKRLTAAYLSRAIQTGQHDPVEDAKAALDLYKLVQKKWERLYGN